MTDNTLPESEAATETQQDAPKLLDVEKYFLSVVESGKQYSICLVKDCCRRFEGNHIETWKTHLTVAHSSNPNSNSTESPNLDVDLSINNDLVLGDDNESETFHLKQNLSETDNFRKYFQIITEDGKIYSKCMVKYCTRRLAGKHANNMKKHLYHMHGKEPYSWSSDTDDEPLENTTPTSSGEGATEKDDRAKVRQHFRMVIEDGKVYSMCLIRGCKRRMAGKRIGNLNMHLRRIHKLKFQMKPYFKPEPIEHLNIRKNFRYFVKNGQIYTKCAINECDFRMVGNHFGNLRRHIEKHKLNGDSFATDGVSDDEEISENIAVDLETKNTRETGQKTVVEKYFKAVQKHGKLYSACLVRGCGHRFPGNHSYNMKRHLSGSHNMVLNDQRKYFETLIENGKMYKKCLVDGCSHRLSGNHGGNMKKHLLLYHNKKMVKETPDASIGPRKYFQCYESDGKKFSKCLVKNCNRHLAGNHRQNLERHLVAVHNMKPFTDCFGNPIKGGNSADSVDNDAFQDQGNSNEASSLSFRDSQQKVGAGKLMEENINQLSSNEGCNELCKTTFGKVETNAESFSTSMSNRSDDGMLATDASQSTEDDEESQSKSEPVENVDVRKHFKSTEIDGKPYSKCLIEGCNTHLTGYRLYHLKRHLLKHNIRVNLISEPTKMRKTGESDRTSRMRGGNLTAQETKDSQQKAENVGKMGCSPSPQMPQNCLDSADVRKHFETVEINGKSYSKCLVNNCGHRTSGNHLYNLKKHLISYHKMDVRFRVQPAEIIRKTFEEVTVDGELYTKCLMENCDFVISGNSLGKLKRHSLTHKLITDGARSYFESFNVNGRYFSKCLIEGCSYRLAGNHLYNLKRHLINRHNMKQFAPSTEIHSDDGIVAANASHSIDKNSTEENSGQGNASNRLCATLSTDMYRTNAAEHLKSKYSTESVSTVGTVIDMVQDDDESLLTSPPLIECRQLESDHLTNADVRKSFETAEIYGKIYSKCLMEGCSSRLSGHRLYDLKRHLAKHNKDSFETFTEGRNRSESGRAGRTKDRNQTAQELKAHSSLSDPSRTCRLCFEEKDDVIDIFSERFNIANVIRLHFPADEVIDIAVYTPNFATSHCSCVFFFYSRSAQTICFRNSCAPHVGRAYRISTHFMFL